MQLCSKPASELNLSNEALCNFLFNHLLVDEPKPLLKNNLKNVNNL